VLTTGLRPTELERALASAMSQQGSRWRDLLVVCNGVEPVPVGADVLTLSLDENVGIPEGRNIGAQATVGDVIIFLDDDASLVGSELVRRALEAFERDVALGAVAFRLIDEQGQTARRHVPRLRGTGADVAGEVTAFLGGAVAVRRQAFDAAGGYPGEYFYALEETDLALGMIDAGWKIRYEPELRVFHPRSDPARHREYLWRTARNRVLLARRRLPWPVGAVYVFDWFVITAVRQRLAPSALRTLVSGTVSGLRTRPVDRAPIRWSTVSRLSRLGRPPII